MARFGSAIVCAIGLLSSTALHAAQAPDAYDYRVLLDTDQNVATGCAVAVKDANIDTSVNGVDQRVIIHVVRTSGSTAQVVGVGRQACTAGSFGAEVTVDPGDWPVGLNDGLGGADVVEGFVPLTAIGDPDGVAQVAFAATKVGGNSDVLLTTNGQAGAGPLLFAFANTSPAPAMTPWSVGLAVLLMSLTAYAALRRYPRAVRLGVLVVILVVGGIVLADVRTIDLDGAVNDWGGVAALGTDAIHDSSAGDDAEDIIAAFMAQDHDNAYFRIDLLNVIDPTATRTNTPGLPTSTATSPPLGAPHTPTETGTATSTPTATQTLTKTPTDTPTQTPPATPTATPVNCADPQTANGMSCNDGNQCRVGATCQSGVCSGGSAVICPPQISQCLSSAGTCNPNTGHCDYPPAGNGTACDDHNACTLTDTCQNGQCTGALKICIPDLVPPQCRQPAKLCDPQNGACLNAISVDGTGCDDGNACTTGDKCTSGVCGGSPCGPGQVCCSQAAHCVDLNTDNNHCGSCGNACGNAVCFQGTCFDGCVISGVAYTNGTLNPGNPCQLCDVTSSRTAWTNLGPNFPNPPQSTCKLGCFGGFCSRGACVVTSAVPNGGACPATSTCIAASCNQNGVCVQTPINENGACTPQLSTSPCRSSSAGICHSGSCVSTSINEGGVCAPVEQLTGDPECRALNGTCVAGVCTSTVPLSATTCHPDPANKCIEGTCNPLTGACGNPHPKACSAPAACGALTCAPATGNCSPNAPFPSFGQIPCGALGDGPHPEQCCPGQGCICPPAGNEFNSVCFFFGCWSEGDFPKPPGAP